MKLSEALERALITGAYGQFSEFMCSALKKSGQEQHVGSVHDMVEAINRGPCSYRDLPLCNVLHNTGYVDMGLMSDPELLAYTTQLYIWWVFDLKRKGE